MPPRKANIVPAAARAAKRPDCASDPTSCRIVRQVVGFREADEANRCLQPFARPTVRLARRLLSADNLSGELAATHCSFLYTGAADECHSKKGLPLAAGLGWLRQARRQAFLRIAGV
jgi:hypothetical protein